MKTTPVASLILQKQANQKFENPPTKSVKQIVTNPILPDPGMEDFRSSKARVPAYMSSPEYEDKSRGLRKGEFSQKGRGTLSFGAPSSTDHKPSRKFIDGGNSEDLQPTVSRKKAICQPEDRNPIFEGEYIRNYNRNPEPIVNAQTSSIGGVLKGDGMFDSVSPTYRMSNLSERNKSSVFDPNAQVISETTRKKPGVVHKQESRDVLQYTNAPKYRDVAVTDKPCYARVDRGAYVDVVDGNKRAEDYKVRRNQSAVTFY